jgi:D-alanyl-D-alanine carboxypeptidase/D-alanyl-D-alanine-endopeptidase (penicillin-binding protein 4)
MVPLLTRRSALALLAAAASAPWAAAARGATAANEAGLSGSLGFIALDVVSGATLDGLNADVGFAPASVAKVPTAMFALETLGPDWRFETRVIARGRLEDRWLRGSLALVGGGDPELDSADVATLAEQASGVVARIEGPVGVEAGPVVPMIDDSVPPQAAYNPSVAGLNLNYNRVWLTWARDKGRLSHAMEAHAAGWSPEVRSVALALEGDDCGCPPFLHEADAAGERWRVRQSLLAGQGGVWLPVRDPAPYAEDVFRSALRRAGVAIEQGPPPQDGGSVVVARRHGRPLPAVLRDMLDFSTNLTAEAVGRAAAAARGVAAVDLAQSAAAMNLWAAERAGFAPGDGFALANHSGLSPDSRVTPRRMAELVRAAALSADGALAKLLPEHPVDEKNARAPKGSVVLAKTGTLDFVRGLSGLAVTASGRSIAFAYFANDLARRDATRGGAGGPPPGARPWRNRAVTLERKLVREWLTRYA